MSIFITLIAALIVFSAVIAIHEFGHFAVAKLCGIQVNEFSIGMGPALWKKIYKGTQYSLRALPVGGYVALEGEESPESQQAEAARDEREAETASPIPPEQRTGIPLNDAPVWQAPSPAGSSTPLRAAPSAVRPACRRAMRSLP